MISKSEKTVIKITNSMIKYYHKINSFFEQITGYFFTSEKPPQPPDQLHLSSDQAV